MDRCLGSLLLLAGLALSVPTCTSSESHIGKTKSLLATCGPDVPCADPEQSCLCVCTVPCDSVEVCLAEVQRIGADVPQDLLRCRVPSCDSAKDDLPSTASGVCDVACTADLDCAALGATYRCLGGYCRPEVASSGEAGQRCAAGSVHVPGASAGDPSELCADRYEVTVSDYGECVTQGACTAPPSGNYYVAGSESHPIQVVGLADAQAFCAFRGARLPTRTEWQWIAQNDSSGSVYPWGDTPASAADSPPRVCALGATATCPVGSFPAGDSARGIVDLAGNVAEIVTDGAGACSAGGGYTVADGSPDLLASSACSPFTAPGDDIGLRCVTAPSPP